LYTTFVLYFFELGAISCQSFAWSIDLVFAQMTQKLKKRLTKFDSHKPCILYLSFVQPLIYPNNFSLIAHETSFSFMKFGLSSFYDYS